MVSSRPADADADETSYVTVRYNEVGSNRTNTANVRIAGNEVTVDVMDDMMAGDNIVVTYHNVMVQGLDEHDTCGR